MGAGACSLDLSSLPKRQPEYELSMERGFSRANDQIHKQ